MNFLLLSEKGFAAKSMYSPLQSEDNISPVYLSHQFMQTWKRNELIELVESQHLLCYWYVVMLRAQPMNMMN